MAALFFSHRKSIFPNLRNRPMTKLLFVVMVVGASVLPTILASGDPCNIHSSSNSNTTQATRLRGSLPVRALPGWLHVSDMEMKEWYDRGKAECGAFLASNATSMKTNFPPPYQESRDIPFQGQSKCRGRDMLYSLSGIVVWPFGPMGGCATYSNCWFGLLTCGELNKQYLSSIATKPILDVLHIHRPGANLPTMGNWSISALRIHLRLLGLEIIVPDQRLVSVASGSNSGMDDVLIGQYVITIPDNNYKLEIRLTELYPSSLYPWSKEDIDVYGMEIPGNIYLGGSESRCNGGHCRWRNVCCGCDEKSFVAGTPIIIDAVSGIEKCPEVLKMRQAHERHSKRKRAHEGVSDSYLDATQKEPASLPLCKAMDSKSPGRWILSSQTRLRTIAKHTVSCHSNRSVNAFSDVPLGSKGPKQESVTGKSAHRHSTGDWFEASGDPCIIKDGDPEDGGESSWFFAPYTCRYHFYTKVELHQCLKAKGISHIHFHGDSMSRDLYLYVARYLGVSTVSESELKRMTNVMKQNNIKTHSEGIIMSEGTHILLGFFIICSVTFPTRKLSPHAR